MAGGILKTVPLSVNAQKGWSFDPDQLRKTLTKKTKLMILNNPHNPTGKLFTRDELQTITDILKDFPDCMVLADEVYDFLTYDGGEHVRFATLGDNWNRTITVYSGGKLFNATGWKIGWAIAHPKLLRLGGIINSGLFYCVNHPGQIAMSKALPLVEKENLDGDGKPSFVA
jgi:aspartate/methionine/tyrosine aminotransferase